MKSYPLNPRFLAVLVSPAGEETYLSFCGSSSDKTQAVRYVSPDVASKGALNHFGRSGCAFWSSERESEERARRRFRGWTHRVEQAPVFQAPFTLWIAPGTACTNDVFPIFAPFIPCA